MYYKNLLLIDDDEDDQEIFITALKSINSPTTFMAIADAAFALKQLKSEQILPDLIFLDINMPGMNGQQFLKEIKSVNKLKSIRIIMFSTSANQQTIDETQLLGANNFITKPSRYDDLREMLSNVLSKSWLSTSFQVHFPINAVQTDSYESLS